MKTWIKQTAVALVAVLTGTMLLACSGEGGGSAQTSDATDAKDKTTTAAKTAEGSENLLEEIKSRGTLKIGTEAQYAPYEFMDMNGDFVGVDVWLADQIAAELGVKVEIVDMAFAGIIPAIQSGQVDLGIGAITKTPDREKEVAFSDLYETSEQYLIVKAEDAELYKDKEALKGKKVGAQLGTVQSGLIEKALPDSELFELEKYPALAMEVQNGNIAGLVVDAAVGDSLIATSNGKLKVAAFEFSAEEAKFGKAVAIAKGQDELVQAVNAVIQRVTKDGSYQKAFDEAVALQKELGIE